MSESEIKSVERVFLAGLPEYASIIDAFFQSLPPELRPGICAFFGGLPEFTEIPGSQFVPEWARLMGGRVREQLMPGMSSYSATQTTLEQDANFFGGVIALTDNMEKIADDFFAVTGRPPPEFDMFINFLKSIPENAKKLPEKEGKRVLFNLWKGEEDAPYSEIFENGPFQRGSPRFVLQFILVLIWPKVEGLKTTTALYDFLAEFQGTGWLGDLATFQRRCREWGIYKRRKNDAKG